MESVERQWGHAKPLPRVARRAKSETIARRPAIRTTLSVRSCGTGGAGRIRSCERLRSRALVRARLRPGLTKRRIEKCIRLVIVLCDRGRQGHGRHVAAQFAAQTFPQLFNGQVSLDLAADGEADRAGLFGTNNGNRVGFFRDADTGSMPRAELRRE